MRVRSSEHSMAEIVKMAIDVREPVEIEDDTGRVVGRVSVPGPLPPEPIDKVRALLTSPPVPSNRHLEQAQALDGFGQLGELVKLLALVEAIRESAREP